MMLHHFLKRFSFILALTVMLGACALGQSEVTVGNFQSIQNDKNGPAVHIAMPSDQRVFELKPASPDIPSLDPADKDTPELRSRSVGRKRGGFGQALGSVVLPEGQTVPVLIQKTVEHGFKKAGYNIIDQSNVKNNDVTVINVTINEFWTWASVSPVHFIMKNRSQLRITSDLPGFENGLIVGSYVGEGVLAGTEEQWSEIIDKSLVMLSDDIATKLPKNKVK